MKPIFISAPYWMGDFSPERAALARHNWRLITPVLPEGTPLERMGVLGKVLADEAAAVRAEDVTVGILCDFAQYDKAHDSVEWDVFRTAIHESQGWRLHRLWTPHFFRDPQRSINLIVRDVEAMLAQESQTPDAT